MQLYPIGQDGSVDLGGAESHPALPEVVAATVALYGRRGFVAPWIGYVAVECNRVIGSCGFAAPPDRTEAEIAYFTFPGHEGRGVATRMATALMALSAPSAQARGLSYTAHTLPAENASTAILRKLGFTHLGRFQHVEDGEVWKWRKTNASLAIDINCVARTVKNP